MTVRQLLGSITSEELTEWMAYDRIDPFGEERSDLRMGILTSALVNKDKPRGGTAAKPKDFMPNFLERRSQPKKMSIAAIKDKLLDIVNFQKK